MTPIQLVCGDINELKLMSALLDTHTHAHTRTSNSNLAALFNQVL